MDDTLLKRTVRSIPRDDVAELTVQCLSLAQAKNRSAGLVEMMMMILLPGPNPAYLILRY